MKKRIGFLFADEMEFLPFAEYALRHGGEKVQETPLEVVSLPTETAMIFAIHSGVGKVCATMAAMTLILEYRVEALLNAGLSGAVSELQRGDMIAGTTYVECDFDVRVFGRRLGEKIEGDYLHQADPCLLEAASGLAGMKKGPLGSGDFFLHTEEKKKEYREEFSVLAFDMESAAIACACDRFSVPFLSVRKISDDADDTAAESYREMNQLAEFSLSEILLKIVERLSSTQGPRPKKAQA